MTVRYELAEHLDGTLVTIHATGTPSRFFDWATTRMDRQVGKNITADLERIRAVWNRLTALSDSRPTNACWCAAVVLSEVPPSFERET